MTARPKTVVTYGPSFSDYVMLTDAQMDALIVLLAWIDVPVTNRTTKLIPGAVNARAVTALTKLGFVIPYDKADGTPMATVTARALYGACAHMPTLELAVARAKERLKPSPRTCDSCGQSLGSEMDAAERMVKKSNKAMSIVGCNITGPHNLKPHWLEALRGIWLYTQDPEHPWHIGAQDGRTHNALMRYGLLVQATRLPSAFRVSEKGWKALGLPGTYQPPPDKDMGTGRDQREPE